MAEIDITRAHTLGLAEARTAAERMEGHLGRKFGLKGFWDGDTLHFERPGVRGSLALTRDKPTAGRWAMAMSPVSFRSRQMLSTLS